MFSEYVQLKIVTFSAIDLVKNNESLIKLINNLLFLEFDNNNNNNNNNNISDINCSC